MTESQHDPFWKELRAKASDSDGYEPMSEAEVERVLAECGEEPLSENEIESIVAEATKTGPRKVVDDETEHGAPHRRHMLKAAAVLVGLSLLAAAVTILVYPEWWTQLKGYNPAKPPQHVSYIETLVNTDHEEEVRLDAAARLVGWLKISGDALRDLVAEDVLKEQATAWLERLRALTDEQNRELLLDGDLENVGRTRETIDQLIKGMLDDRKSTAERRSYLDAVGKQARYGILALKRAAQEPDSRLTKSCRALLRVHLPKYLR